MWIQSEEARRAEEERGAEVLFPLRFSVGSSFSYCTAVTGWRQSYWKGQMSKDGLGRQDRKGRGGTTVFLILDKGTARKSI